MAEEECPSCRKLRRFLLLGFAVIVAAVLVWQLA
jgi:hypothetical protein